MDLKNKNVVIVGLAQTGIAVAHFCMERGAKVTVTDAKSEESLSQNIAQLPTGVSLDLGGHTLDFFLSADLIVMSPGVPDLEECKAARDAGIEVIAEIELAYRFLHPEATLIAITGTNGKSTTTSLIGAICQASGKPTYCGGNLGNSPLIDAVTHPANSSGGYVVVEVAGFMLETCTSFQPNVAICLNITEDHLDRYKTMEVYSSMKTRVYKWQEPSDFAIANNNCALTLKGAKAASGSLCLFDSTKELPTEQNGTFLRDADIVIRINNEETTFPIADLKIVGHHNLENAMVSYLATLLVGVPPEAIRSAAKEFKAPPPPHGICRRMERHPLLR